MAQHVRLKLLVRVKTLGRQASVLCSSVGPTPLGTGLTAMQWLEPGTWSQGVWVSTRNWVKLGRFM